MIVHEIEGHEVVVGSVGQFWHLDIPFRKVNSEEFRKFNEPGWGKLVWAISVEPYLEGITISFELRTTVTDEESWTKLNHYYHVIGIGSRLIRGSLMAHINIEAPIDIVWCYLMQDVIEPVGTVLTGLIMMECLVLITWWMAGQLEM